MTELSKVAVTRQTGQHIARMFSGDMRESEINEIKSWHAACGEQRAEFVDMLHTLADLENIADDPEIRAVAAVGLLQCKRRIRSRHVLSTAAVLLVAVTIGLLYFDSNFLPWQQQTAQSNILLYNTRLGEQKTVNLDDGSIITLNTGTQLLVDMNDQYRRVILERGEAFFNVAQDPTRPFNVNVDSRSISVLGTEFTLRKSPGKLTLAVLEGLVAIHRKEEQVETAAPMLAVEEGKIFRSDSQDQQRISAGTVAEVAFENGEMLAYKVTDTSHLYSWRKGFLRFEEEPLYKVVQELNRYSYKKILIEDTNVMNLKVFSVVRLEHINIALDDFEKTLPIKLIRDFDRIVIVGNK